MTAIYVNKLFIWSSKSLINTTTDKSIHGQEICSDEGSKNIEIKKEVSICSLNLLLKNSSTDHQMACKLSATKNLRLRQELVEKNVNSEGRTSEVHCKVLPLLHREPK